MNDRTLKENCGNCANLTWGSRDEKWDTGGEYREIHPIHTKCSLGLRGGFVDRAKLFMSECLFWTGGAV